MGGNCPLLNSDQKMSAIGQRKHYWILVPGG